MIYSTKTKKSSVSSIGIDNEGKIETSNVTVYYNSETNENDMTIDSEPNGDIISIIVTHNGEDFPIDGQPNIAGRKLSLLKGENLNGATAEIKYMI